MFELIVSFGLFELCLFDSFLVVFGCLCCIRLICVCLSCGLFGLWLFESLELCMLELIGLLGLFGLCLFESLELFGCACFVVLV